MAILRSKPVGAAVAAVVFFLIWHVAAIILNKVFLPTPFVSFAAFFRIIASGEILGHFFVSACRIVLSLVIAGAPAVFLGIWMGRNKAVYSFFAPFVFFLYPLPKVVFLPIIVILTGIGNTPKIAIIGLVVFFQVVVVALDASKSVPLSAVQSIRSLNAGKFQIYWHLIVPFALPQIFTSLRISLGTATAVLFFAESFASANGIGYFIMDSMSRRSYDLMYAGIIAMALLGLAAYAVTDLAERYFCRWRKN